MQVLDTKYRAIGVERLGPITRLSSPGKVGLAEVLPKLSDGYYVARFTVTVSDGRGVVSNGLDRYVHVTKGAQSLCSEQEFRELGGAAIQE